MQFSLLNLKSQRFRFWLVDEINDFKKINFNFIHIAFSVIASRFRQRRERRSNLSELDCFVV